MEEAAESLGWRDKIWIKSRYVMKQTFFLTLWSFLIIYMQFRVIHKYSPIDSVSAKMLKANLPSTNLHVRRKNK